MLLLQELIKIPNAIFPFHKAEIACIVFETIITIMKKYFPYPILLPSEYLEKRKKKIETSWTNKHDIGPETFSFIMEHIKHKLMWDTGYGLASGFFL